MPSTSSAPSVTRGYALAAFDYLRHAGHEPEQVFGATLVRAVLDAPASGRLPLAQWEAILQGAGRHLGDPAFALKLAATIKVGNLGMLGFLLMSCETLGAAALTLQRFEQLFDGINEARFSMEGDRLALTWHPLVPDPPIEFTLMSMALWIRYARWLAERPDLAATVEFSFDVPAAPELRAAIEQTFGAGVRYRMPSCRLLAPASYLELPVVHSNREVHASLCQRAEADLVRLLGDDHDLVSQLEAVLAANLAGRQTGIERSARALGMAPRTLQAKLVQQGLTYREVLDRVRCREAERWLRDTTKGLADVAALIGFSDQSSFQHAFRRWHGCSPGEWRRALA